MKEKTSQQLVQETGDLRRRIAEPEAAEAGRVRAEEEAAQATACLESSLAALWDGGRLTVRTEVAGPEWVAVSFADTLVGIREENLDQLFEPFFTTRAKGIDLRLALAKTLVEGHGGSIGVKSGGVPGKGSTFTVILPTREEMS